MTANDQGFEYFKLPPTFAERIAEAEANSDQGPVPDPATLNFDPVETDAGWTFPGAGRAWRSDDEAKIFAYRARAQAGRDYANYVNALPVPELTAGQEALQDHREALAAFIEDGGTEAQAAAFPHLLERYRTNGFQEYEQYKRNR